MLSGGGISSGQRLGRWAQSAVFSGDEDEFAPLALKVKAGWAWGTQIQGLPGTNAVFVSRSFVSLGSWR